MMPTNLPDPQERKEESREKLLRVLFFCVDRAGHRLRIDRLVVVGEMMVNPFASPSAGRAHLAAPDIPRSRGQ